MAVGGEGVRLFASESYEKRLKVGQYVQYWSTSKNKWIDAVVKAVDATGAVQISVKPRAWLNQQEQSTKIRSIVPLLPPKSAEQHGESKTTEFIAESSQRPENAKYTNGFGIHGVTNGTKPPAAGAAADAAQRSDRSKAMYSVFSEWDSQRQGITKNSGPVVPGRIPPSGLRQELKVFKENEKDIRQYKLFLLQQPQRCVRKRVTSLLWQTFYNVVREKCAKLRQQPDRRKKANGDGSNSSRADLEADFKVALEEAETCLQHICTEVREKVESADTSEEDAERLQAHREILGHLCIMLADLERYRAMSGSCDSEAALARADKLYCASLSACSELGQAFNQRGLVAAHQGNKLKAVRCGFHSMLCAIRFPKSEQNLLVWLGQVAEDTSPQSVVDRLRGSKHQSLGRAAQGAVCQLQLTLLQLRESDSGEPSQRQGALGELINKAQAKMKEAVAGMDSHKGGQGPDLEWILETLMISICAAAYHRRGQPQATGKPTVLDKLMDGYTSTAFWAWDWVVRFGLCLAKETKEGESEESGASPFLAPLGLLCLLAARVVPHSWRSSVSAPLHDALRQLDVSEENAEAAELLRFALPEDEVAAGLLPVAEKEKEGKEGSWTAAGKTSEDEASEDEVVLQTPVVKIASPEKKVDSPGANPIRAGSRPMAPAHLHTQVRRARLSFCLRTAAEGVAKELRPEAPPPRGPETRLPAAPAAADFQGAWGGAWGEEHGWADGYDDSGWPAWGNDEWGDGWAENHMDEGQTLEELGEEPDLWDMPDIAAAGDAPWYGGYGYGPPPGNGPSVPPGYGASAWLAGTQEAWYGMAQNPPALPAPAPGLEAVGCLGPPPGLARMPESHPEADGCHLPLVDLAFLDEDADMDPKPSIAGPSVQGANRRPPPPSCLPPPPPRGH